MLQKTITLKTQINLNIQNKANYTFGNEEEELLQYIFQSYKQFLEIENSNVQKSRKFIGKIKRVILQNTINQLQTLDEVQVFTKTISLFGEALPIISKTFLVTDWKEGYPEKHNFTTMTHIKGSSTRKVFVSTFPFEKTQEREETVNEAPYSFIYCLPKFDFHGDDDYHYLCSSDDIDVSFSDYLNQCIQRCHQILQHHVVEQEEKIEQEEEEGEVSNFAVYTIETFENPLNNFPILGTDYDQDEELESEEMETTEETQETSEEDDTEDESEISEEESEEEEERNKNFEKPTVY